MALLDEGRRQVERGGRLRHAALLVGEGDDLGLAGHGETPRVGWENHRPRFAPARAFSCPRATMGGGASEATRRLGSPASRSASPMSRPCRSWRAAPRRRCSSSSRSAAGSRSRARRHARRARGLRRRARRDAADGRRDGPGARQRAAHPGDHGADDGPAAGARRAGVADRVPRLPRRCGSIHYAVLLAAFIYMILGGVDEFTGSYETLTGWLGIVPQGPTAAHRRHARRADRCGRCSSARVQVADLPARARQLAGAPAVRRRRRRAGAAGDGARLRRASTRARSCSPPRWPAPCCWRAHRGCCCSASPPGSSPPGCSRGPTATRSRSALALAGLLAFAALTGGLLSGAGPRAHAAARRARGAARRRRHLDARRGRPRRAARDVPADAEQLRCDPLRARGGRRARAASTPARG